MPASGYSATTILSGATASAAVACGELVPVGLVLPAALTGTSLTFTVSSDDGATFVALYSDDGTAYTVTVAASRYVALDYTKFLGWTHVKLVSGSAEGADRALVVRLRSL